MASELHDAIRFLADHIFRDQSADSVAKRATLEGLLTAGESAAPVAVVQESEQASGGGTTTDASSADAPVNPSPVL